MSRKPKEIHKCRTCYSETKAVCALTTVGTQSAATQSISYAEMLKEVTNINMTEDHQEMPQHICFICCEKLEKSYAFIKQALSVNEQRWSLVRRLSGSEDNKDCLKELEIDVDKYLEIELKPNDVCETKIGLTDFAGEALNDVKVKQEFDTIEPQESGERNCKRIKIEPLETDDEAVPSPSSSDSDYVDENDNNEDSNTEEMPSKKPMESPKTKKAEPQKVLIVKPEDMDLAVPCPQCNKIFKNSKDLTLHLSTTHVPEDQKCACPICGAKFTRKCNMYNHIRKLHGKDVIKDILPQREKAYECHKCHRKYTEKKKLNYHIKHKHNQKAEAQSESEEPKQKKPEVRPLCFVCGISFCNKAHLLVHMRRHTGEKPYQCDMCDRAFPRVSELNCHRRIHTGEKPFKCTICEKSFRLSDKLTNHMRSHSNERPYKCGQCERSFKYSRDLSIHTRIHTGERPYRCNVCGSTFTQSNSLKTHRTKLGHMDESA